MNEIKLDIKSGSAIKNHVSGRKILNIFSKVLIKSVSVFSVTLPKLDDGFVLGCLLPKQIVRINFEEYFEF